MAFRCAGNHKPDTNHCVKLTKPKPLPDGGGFGSKGMAKPKPPLVVIVGPTAAGKSALAVRLARTFGGEVVSADSRQVYRGLDVGTGKISKRAMRGVPHHLLNVAGPKRPFDVVRFQRLAERAIRDVARRGRLPFLVGGTGLWVDAVAFGIGFPAAPPNRTLRRRLATKRARDLLAALRRLDPERAKTIEPQNPRRIIRAIEIARAIGYYDHTSAMSGCAATRMRIAQGGKLAAMVRDAREDLAA